MQGERVKQVRSYFHLTLEKFGDKLGRASFIAYR